jgi:glycosyltransferase involved in cell wall biosynthesis
VSIAEASACGLPVVVTDSGGIPDQVTDGENGFIAPQRNVERLSELMLRLANDQGLRERLGRAGRERVIRSFDSRTMTRQLEDRLLQVAGRSVAG